MILVLGKARSCRVPNLGCRGAESPGWFDVSLKNSAQDVMHEWVHCCDEAANHQLPTAAAVLVILHLNRWRTLRQYSLLIIWPEEAYSWWTTPSQSKNTVNMVLILLRLCPAFFGCGEPATSIGKTGPSFLDHSHSSTILSVVMTFLRKSGSLVVVWIKSLANAAQIKMWLRIYWKWSTL